jgi:prepilin peptidase CpaA
MYSISSLDSLLILFLAVAVYFDFRYHRIPNVTALAIGSMGLFGHLALDGLHGAQFALGGLGLGMGFLLPFYVLGGMGAGDVKLMGAIGAFLGPQQTLFAVGVTLILGALGALGLLLTGYRRQRPLTSEVSNSHDDGAAEATGITPVLKARFPYALAIAGGALTALFFLPI